MKTYFAINVYEKLNLSEDYLYLFLPLQVKMWY